MYGDLRSCPFCRCQTVELRKWGSENYLVECSNPNCNAKGSISEDKETAIRVWNKVSQAVKRYNFFKQVINDEQTSLI